MDSAGSSNPIIKKQEDDDKNDKRDLKPVPKTLNRVPRKLFIIYHCNSHLSSAKQIKGACVSKILLSENILDSQIYPECL